MDRIDAIRVFVAALDEGSLAGASRKLGRSPAAVSRAVAFLEGQVGVKLLHRSTRSKRLSEAGELYATACRRLLTDLDEADAILATGRSDPRGVLTVAAPVISGEDILRPIVHNFLNAFSDVSVKLNLVERSVNLLDEGIDVALRIGHLPASSMIAVRVGEVRQLIVAAPSYLAKNPRIDEPSDLAMHHLITATHFGINSWTFPPAQNSMISRVVQFRPRFVVDSTRAAVVSTIEGHGVTRVFSCQVAEHLRAGRLQIVLGAHEHKPLPVHLITLDGRLSVPKIRAFIDFALPRLRTQYSRLAVDTSS
jgi:DNA-binding transcriptional LysR family regulator